MTPRIPRLLFLALAGTAALTPEALAAAPRYRMVLDASNAAHGVQTLSLVQSPAIQKGWVALSAAEPATAKRFHLSTATEGPARQVLTGPALLPGQQILRLDAEGSPFYIVFDEATIEGTARQFAAQARHTSTNQDHTVSLTGNVVYESWLVADPANDKAAALGLDVPAGTWMLSVHIPDAAYWQNEVVTGNKTGFSIEGLFETEQLTLSAVAPAPQPVKKNWFSTLLAALASMGSKEASTVTVALGLVQLADGRTVHVDDATGAVTVPGEDGAPGEPLPDGSYPLAGGGELVVQGGMRVEGEQKPADLGTDTPGTAEKQPDATALPAPLAPDATTADLVAAVNKLLEQGKEKQPAESPATAPAGQKLATQLHGAAVAELKLDAIDLQGGEKLTYNTVTRRLTDKDGALVDSGYYAAGDGSYFQVDISQYIWEISKSTYDAVYGAKLQAVELADLRTKLASEPAAGKVHLGAAAAEEEKPKTRLQLAREVAAAAK